MADGWVAAADESDSGRWIALVAAPDEWIGAGPTSAAHTADLCASHARGACTSAYRHAARCPTASAVAAAMVADSAAVPTDDCRATHRGRHAEGAYCSNATSDTIRPHECSQTHTPATPTTTRRLMSSHCNRIGTAVPKHAHTVQTVNCFHLNNNTISTHFTQQSTHKQATKDCWRG